MLFSKRAVNTEGDCGRPATGRLRARRIFLKNRMGITRLSGGNSNVLYQERVTKKKVKRREGSRAVGQKSGETTR